MITKQQIDESFLGGIANRDVGIIIQQEEADFQVALSP